MIINRFHWLQLVNFERGFRILDYDGLVGFGFGQVEFCFFKRCIETLSTFMQFFFGIGKGKVGGLDLFSFSLILEARHVRDGTRPCLMFGHSSIEIDNPMKRKN